MRVSLVGLSVVVGILSGCSSQPGTEEVLRRYDIHGMEDVVTRSGVAFDPEITNDANGSLRLTAASTTTFRLYEVTGLDVEDTRLIYRAKIRSEDVGGKAYLEMWCSFPGLGEFFSRALHQPVSGTNEWTTQETPFFLKAGQNPDRVKLNLVVEGSGTVWIDDVVLARAE
jgi:hypothetical protein